MRCEMTMTATPCDLRFPIAARTFRDRGRREIRRRLVHDDESGVERGRPGDGHGLLLAAGDRPNRGVDRRYAEPEPFDEVRRAFAHLRLVDEP